jgi:hypothetical protein
MPIASPVDRGSSSKKEGTVNARVTTTDMPNGRIRKANSKSAAPRADLGRSVRRINFHPREINSDKKTYSRTNTASETPMHLAANIIVSPFGDHFGFRCEAPGVFDPAVAADHPATQRRVR